MYTHMLQWYDSFWHAAVLFFPFWTEPRESGLGARCYSEEHCICVCVSDSQSNVNRLRTPDLSFITAKQLSTERKLKSKRMG